MTKGFEAVAPTCIAEPGDLSGSACMPRQRRTKGDWRGCLSRDPQRLGQILSDGAGSEYVWGLGLISHVATNGATYAQADGLGSIRLVTDASGNQAGTQTFDAYGASRSLSGTQLPFGFSGQQTDLESGLQYLCSREYDPATGRFLSQDPLSAIPGWGGAYPYANDSPALYTDPSGLWTFGICLNGIAGALVFGSASGCVVVASNGDVGVTGTAGGGATTAGVLGVGVGLQGSSGTSLADLGGPFGDLGGTVGEGGKVGCDYFWAPNPSDTSGTLSGPVQGASCQLGLGGQLTGPIPAEAHGGATTTKTAGLNVRDIACRIVGLGCRKAPKMPRPGNPSPVGPTPPVPLGPPAPVVLPMPNC